MNDADGYLTQMDAYLAGGVSLLPASFRQRQARRVLESQCEDGGFAGPRGGSDLYYTRFALEATAILNEPFPEDGRRGAARYLAECGVGRPSPATVVDWLSLLHGMKLVGEAATGALWSARAREARSLLARCRGDAGGFADTPGAEPGVYHTFLAFLCYNLMGDALPEAARAAVMVRAAATADGGFAERRGRDRGQTNPTAAAIGVLAMTSELDMETAAGAATLLAAMQGEDGGLRAHAGATESDLLSTFTGLWALASLGWLGGLRLGAVGRFVRSLAEEEGGFRGAASATASDVEYTFYGLGSLGVLAQAVRGETGSR